jgi:hypothetical protein
MHCIYSLLLLFFILCIKTFSNSRKLLIH